MGEKQSIPIPIPKPKAKPCNHAISLFDDSGQNPLTVRCNNPIGHKGPHREQWEHPTHGKVSISWEK